MPITYADDYCDCLTAEPRRKQPEDTTATHTLHVSVLTREPRKQCSALLGEGLRVGLGWVSGLRVKGWVKG